MLVIGHTAGFNELGDVAGQDFANPWDLLEPPFLGQKADFTAKVGDGLCSASIGSNPKRVFALQFKQVSDLKKGVTNPLIIHNVLRTAKSIESHAGRRYDPGTGATLYD